MNFMTEDARTWALPHLEKLNDSKLPFADWPKFVEAFTRRFESEDKAMAAKNALRKLKQLTR